MIDLPAPPKPKSNIDPNLWTCPHCGTNMALEHDRYSSQIHTLVIKNDRGRVSVRTRYIVCANRSCNKFSLFAHLAKSRSDGNLVDDTLLSTIRSWKLVPTSKAKVFPACVPQHLIDTYTEACEMLRYASRKEYLSFLIFSIGNIVMKSSIDLNS